MSYWTPTVDNRPSPSIALIGLLGSGKTTLACTLANRLVSPDENGIYLVPIGFETMDTVQRNWARLQQRDWPISNLQGTFIELRWKLHVSQNIVCELRLADVSGQDLYDIFARDNFRNAEQFDPVKKSVFAYCQEADIVLFLVNLADFLGEGDSGIRISREAAIKSALDHLLADSRPRRVCIVLTQAELLKDEAKQRGSWERMLREVVPFIYHAHLRDRQIKYIPVSAVYDTEIVNDPVTGPRRVPSPGFRSIGHDDLIKWIVTQVRELWAINLPQMQASPLVVESRQDWKGVVNPCLEWTAVVYNEGVAGAVRVIATSHLDNIDVESLYVDITLNHDESQIVTIRFSKTLKSKKCKSCGVRYEAMPL